MFERNIHPIFNSLFDIIYFDSFTLGIIAFAYLPIIFGIKKYMDNKEPYKGELSNNLLCYWNMFLSISSGIGFVILFNYLYHELFVLHKNIYQVDFYNNYYASLVVNLFGLSKFFEFIDTLFIVFRKSQLEFIHWYHHVITCLYTWHSCYIVMNTGIYFAFMNLFVHTIMYFYYGLLAKKIMILYPYKKVLTILQITQMIFGTTLCIFWFKYTSNYKYSELINNIIALLMYFSYFMLFIKILFRTKNKTN